MAGIGSTRITRTGVVCLACQWRNPGTGTACSNCGADLIPARPDQADAWVAAQLEIRSRLGLPVDAEAIEVLTDWAFLGERADGVIGDGQDPRDRIPSDTDDPGPIVAAAAACCTACDARFPESVAFCSKCGSPTQEVEPTLAEVFEALEQLDGQVVALRQAVGRLERGGVVTDDAVSFSWLKVPSSEKWSVTWGVFGRSILINVAIYVGLMLLLAAIVGLGSLPG